MEFDEVLLARHSVRVFRSDPVPREVLEAILRDAGRAPSWVDAQEWRVWAVQGAAADAVRAEYKVLASQGVKGSSEIPAAHRSQWSTAAQSRMASLGELIAAAGVGETMARVQDTLYEAPVLLIFTIPKGAPEWALLDLGGFYQTLMLAAASRGVGSIPSYNIVKYPNVLRRILSIPGDERIIVGVALGYEADDPINALRTTRAHLGDYVTFVG